MENGEFDVALSVAITEEDEGIASIPQTKHEFSEEHRKKMRSLFKAMNRKRQRKQILLKTAAVTIATAMLVGSAVAANFWDEIRSFIIQQYDGYIEARIEPDIEPYEVSVANVPEGWTEFWWPDYMTEGYEFVRGDEFLVMRELIFSNGENELNLNYWDAESGLRLDDDGVSDNVVYVNGYVGSTLIKEIDGASYNFLAWSNGATNFKLVGTVSFEELASVAESLVWIESEE